MTSSFRVFRFPRYEIDTVTAFDDLLNYDDYWYFKIGKIVSGIQLY